MHGVESNHQQSASNSKGASPGGQKNSKNIRTTLASKDSKNTSVTKPGAFGAPQVFIHKYEQEAPYFAPAKLT